MRILVTGGAGFIGSHIVDTYLAAGHDVCVVDNLSTGFRENVNPAASFVECDICSDKIEKVFAQHKPQVVNHLAAQMDVRRSLESPVFDADSNILGSIRLLECCVKHQADKFIFASTGGAIYGEPETLPAAETCEPRPLCHYGVSKYCAEQYVQLYSRLYDLDYTVLRFANVYGPRQNPHGEAGVCAIFILQMIKGAQPILYGHGEPLRDYVYVEDVARANLLALEMGSGEIINLGTARGTSVRAVYDAIKSILSYGGEPILKPRRVGEVDRVYLANRRAKEALGWQPEVDLNEGLRRTAAQIGDAARRS
ncbi:MAG TPA: NAD-dependent epimerase/dehydratase family protein [Candidatus Hydrogenedentes bacterium]|nr:NAD-dependent epimerase/dehydratase family protein [Candidatus Hydrogenedentota bacterium]